MTSPNTQRAGFSLVELLIMIAVMGIAAGVMLTHLEPAQHEQLVAAANVVASDLAYARNLAVTNNSDYRVTFYPSENKYVLEHKGSDTAYNDLPDTAFRKSSDLDTQQTTDFDELPQLGVGVELASVLRMSSYTIETPMLQFTSLGSTATVHPTVIWLGAGRGNERRYISIEVNPVTGLATLGPFRAAPPPVSAQPQ